MSSETVRDIIDRVRGIHLQLSHHYQSLGDTAQKERVRILLQYLSRHEAHLDAALAKFQGAASKALLGTWFKGEPDSSLRSALDEVKIAPGMETDQVIRTVLQVDRALVDAFRKVVDSAHADDVKALFQELIQMEEREEHKLMRDALELEDV